MATVGSVIFRSRRYRAFAGDLFLKIRGPRLSCFALLMMLIGVGLPRYCDAKPYQAQDAFKAAILDKSTWPYIVLIEVVDDRTGQSSIGCNTANMLLGAIYLETWGAFDRSHTPEARTKLDRVDEIALANTSHVFHFSTEAALKNVLPLRYPGACAAIAQGKRARIEDRTGQVLFGPFTEGPSIDWRMCPPAAYPLETKLTTEGGTALSLFIGPDGRVKESKVTESSGSPVLDDTIRKALSACLFTPRTVDDVPIADGARMSVRLGNRAVWPFAKPQ